MTVRKTYRELSEIARKQATNLRLPGLFRHTASNVVYHAFSIHFREADMVLCVLYAPLDEPSCMFSRPLNEFKFKFVRTS